MQRAGPSSSAAAPAGAASALQLVSHAAAGAAAPVATGRGAATALERVSTASTSQGPPKKRQFTPQESELVWTGAGMAVNSLDVKMSAKIDELAHMTALHQQEKLESETKIKEAKELTTAADKSWAASVAADEKLKERIAELDAREAAIEANEESIQADIEANKKNFAENERRGIELKKIEEANKKESKRLKDLRTKHGSFSTREMMLQKNETSRKNLIKWAEQVLADDKLREKAVQEQDP